MDRDTLQQRARLGGLAAAARPDRDEALTRVRAAFERRFRTPEERQEYFARLSALGVAARRAKAVGSEEGGAR